MSPRLRAALYAQAGAVFSLHPCLYAGDRPTAGRSRFATLLPGDAAVSPSNGDHAGTQRADPPPPRNGPKHRGAGRSRSATGPPRQSRSTRQFFCAEVLGSRPQRCPRDGRCPVPTRDALPPLPADLVASLLDAHAAWTSFVDQRNSLPSRSMRWSMTESLRATATVAFLVPIRRARRVPQAFSTDQRGTRWRMIPAASYR